MQETREHVDMDTASFERGYKSCRSAVKQFYRGYEWIGGNLPGPTKRHLDALLYNLVRTVDLFDLESVDGRSLDVWQEMRDDLIDALDGKSATVELAALSDTAQKYVIPRRHIVDPIVAADGWIRNRKFDTFEELETFAGEIGGSVMASTVPVLGFVNPDFESAAIECGKAIFLTQLLAQCVNSIKVNKNFLAQQDLDDCEIVVHRLKLRQGGQPLKYLVRLYCHRIDKIMQEGAKLVSYLDYDGRRTVTSLLAMHWRMLMQMKVDPDSILSEEGVLSRRDLLGLKSRHLLGLEGNIPIVPVGNQHGH